MTSIGGRYRTPALLAIALTASAAAQYAVNTQLNTEVYGRGVGSVRRGNVPFNQATLRSDFRHDAFLSGALRSDIRGQYGAVGPLAPSGAISYIPNTARPYGRLGSPSGVVASGGYARAWQPDGGAARLPGLPAATATGYGAGSAYTSTGSIGSTR